MYQSVEIGKRIKKQRELLGITREELSEKSVSHRVFVMTWNWD